MKTTTVTVDAEVWSELQKRLRLTGNKDSKNKVLRRLFGLDKDDTIVIIEGKTSYPDGELLSWVEVNRKTLLNIIEEKFNMPNKIRVTVEVIE